MKKICLLLMAISAIVMLTNCEKSDSKKSETDIKGCWKLISSLYVSGNYSNENEAYGNEYLCLENDGSYELLIPHLECAGKTGSWSRSGDILNLIGNPVDYHCGDLKILSESGSDLKIRWTYNTTEIGYMDFTFIKQ
jgi:hypothetical protein